MKVLLLLAVISLLPASAFGADIDGRWSGESRLSCTFLAQGTNLTGSCFGIGRDALTITEGQIKGDEFTFSLETNADSVPAAIHFAGKVNGAKLRMTASYNGRTTNIELFRAARIIPVVPEPSEPSGFFSADK